MAGKRDYCCNWKRDRDKHEVTRPYAVKLHTYVCLPAYLALADGLDNEVAVRQRLLELHDAHDNGLALEGPLL